MAFDERAEETASSPLPGDGGSSDSAVHSVIGRDGSPSMRTATQRVEQAVRPRPSGAPSRSGQIVRVDRLDGGFRRLQQHGHRPSIAAAVQETINRLCAGWLVKRWMACASRFTSSSVWLT